LLQKLKIVYYVEPDADALAARAAQYFVETAERAVAARGQARIAISGGSTPKATFALLADPAQPWRARMPWDRIDLWWVDERCVPPDHPESNYRMTREAMLDHVPLAPGQIHRMEGELEPGVAAARYESELSKSFRLQGPAAPAFDLIQLGMGPDGHTASLFPRTHALHELERLVTANHVDSKDAWRITLTWPVINRAADVFFLVGGEDKARILRDVFIGPRDAERLPSQLIAPANGILSLLLDRAAAALLPSPDALSRGVIERT
jgi:6-phosphogluconolactonase